MRRIPLNALIQERVLKETRSINGCKANCPIPNLQPTLARIHIGYGSKPNFRINVLCEIQMETALKDSGAGRKIAVLPFLVGVAKNNGYSFFVCARKGGVRKRNIVGMKKQTKLRTALGSFGDSVSFTTHPEGQI
jgi:hypothetical protein